MTRVAKRGHVVQEDSRERSDKYILSIKVDEFLEILVGSLTTSVKWKVDNIARRSVRLGYERVGKY